MAVGAPRKLTPCRARARERKRLNVKSTPLSESPKSQQPELQAALVSPIEPRGPVDSRLGSRPSSSRGCHWLCQRFPTKTLYIIFIPWCPHAQGVLWGVLAHITGEKTDAQALSQSGP